MAPLGKRAIPRIPPSPFSASREEVQPLNAPSLIVFTTRNLPRQHRHRFPSRRKGEEFSANRERERDAGQKTVAFICKSEGPTRVSRIFSTSRATRFLASPVKNDLADNRYASRLARSLRPRHFHPFSLSIINLSRLSNEIRRK